MMISIYHEATNLKGELFIVGEDSPDFLTTI